MEIVPAFGWSRCLRLSNGDVELVATLDVGPRILSYRLLGGTEVLKRFDDQMGTAGDPSWMIRGGHRLWLAPEDPGVTYYPDNAPVKLDEPSPGVVRLVAPEESGVGVRKEIDVHLPASGSWVRLVHRVVNVGGSPRTFAPWALTVLAPGGTEVIPLPEKRPHPGAPGPTTTAADFAPDRALILWPFFDFTDDRWSFGRRFLRLRQEAGRGPTKLGIAHREGVAAYVLGETLFVKRFDGSADPAGQPDLGANFETFTNGDMLEMESIGPLARVGPGDSVEWEETWELFGGVGPVDLGDEASIADRLGPYLALRA